MINKIRSKYILKAISSYLNTRFYLKLFKYNKKLKKRLDITKKEYKLYNQIEIDIIPIEFNKNIDKQNIINFFYRKSILSYIHK